MKATVEINTKIHKIMNVIILFVFVISSALCFKMHSAYLTDKKIGMDVVNCIYNFYNLYELNANQSKLKSLVTDSVYTELTIDNEDRLLSTYLKFKGNTTSVNIIKATNTYVLYRLETASLSSDRVFIFMFECNGNGKISYVREAECLDFVEVND